MQQNLRKIEQLDLITYEPLDEEYALIIAATGSWVGSREEQNLLARKLNSYTMYILDGGLERRFPETAGRPKRIQIDCLSSPPDKIMRLVSRYREFLSAKGIGLHINLING